MTVYEEEASNGYTLIYLAEYATTHDGKLFGHLYIPVKSLF